MICEHLAPLETLLLDAEIRVTFRGKAWSENCREWVYVDCVLNTAALREQISFPFCVKKHEYIGTHDGQEAGFVCDSCHDGIMGIHPDFAKATTKVFG